ncbi:hypothetical protein [Reichenbachiella sp. MSK19-1]|uniref:hypothetical protein n=1 Tax=Reichenbachiella sp. MSK19-1 TaxID=1897631 RepID=UPI000E6BFB9D|nr:hypothetical protein [Reichenbachiella sp. MSK19-1]RJE70348.1 hypothetical protein BGP76_09625 [Reichenbachiella sp. MSK19-1]
MNQLKLNAKLFAAILVFGALASCEESDNGDDSNSCHITSMVFSYPEDDYGYSYASDVTFEYNDANQLISILSVDNETECYDNNCETSTDENEIFLSYAGDVITLTNSSYEGEKIEILISGDKLEKITSSEIYNGEKEIDEYRYIYSGDKLSKVENWDNYSNSSTSELTIYSYDEVTFSGNNISMVESFYESENANARKLGKKEHVINARTNESISVGKVSYSYDTNTNPMKGELLALLIGGYEYFNENNILSEKEIYDHATYTYNYSYEYNDDGLPIIITVTDDEGGKNVTDVTYDCD